ncbi:phosphatidate cytidylyltransferase [Pacificibacter maritimus]|uniref:Phosphatidate cytidylyltransferase n=1 Tax=Pacificibacter maritimus TaxID=762213 RepID=A0A3N4UN73_9RHOB|nr:phosphatidate cytidylyltransferase [Pacificibacter maritimus]RPE71468.1 phosphatidate cytidylyltransferase [Pacificibacter maritimus]
MNESRKAFMRKWRDLGPRTLSAVVMVAIGGAAIAAGHMAFSGLVICAGVIGLWELFSMGGHKSKTDGLGLMDKIWLLLYGLVVVIGLIGLVYISNTNGLRGILYIIGLVIITDTCGYFVGKMIGGRKFWPSISPNKTWAGVLGGWIGVAIFAAIWRGVATFHSHRAGSVDLTWLENSQSHTENFVVLVFVIGAVFLSFASQLGDIAQSTIKRRMGVKDSSNLIPGHGGILDRFDALLAVSALSFLFNMLA